MKVVQRNVSNLHMEPLIKLPFVMVQGTTSRCLQILWKSPRNMIDTSNYQLPEYDLWRFRAGPILFSCADVRWSALCHANSGRGGAVQGWLFLVPLDICTIPMWKPHLCIVLIMDKLLGKHFYPACECVFVKEYLPMPMKKRGDTSRSRGAILSLTWHWWS